MLEEINTIYKNIRRLDARYLGWKIFKEKQLKKDIADLNREQLLSGENADGESLPRYVDDPYFTSVEAALRYQAWKSHISIGDKPAEVMDFYIDGTFHRTIKFKRDDEGFFTESNSPIANSVQNKTQGKALGINDESLEELYPDILQFAQEYVFSEIQKNL